MEREAEWTDSDVALLLAARELRADIGPHGHPMSEASDALADPARRFEGWHYEPRVRIDHAQRVLNLAQKARQESYPEEDSGSLIWSLTKVDDSTPH